MATKEQCSECVFCSLMSQDLGFGRLHVFCDYMETQITPSGGECDYFEQTEYDSSCWNDVGTLKADHYWKLRKQISVGSCFLGSYDNSYGIENRTVYDFFEGYENFIDEKMKSDHGDGYDYESLFDEYDNEDNLLEYVDEMFESPLTIEMSRRYHPQ